MRDRPTAYRSRGTAGARGYEKKDRLYNVSLYVYNLSIDPQGRNPTSTRDRNHLGRAGRAGLRRGPPVPRRNLCAADEHKPKKSTFKKKTLWRLSTLPYLALDDGDMGSRQMLHSGGGGRWGGDREAV